MATKHVTEIPQVEVAEEAEGSEPVDETDPVEGTDLLAEDGASEPPVAVDRLNNVRRLLPVHAATRVGRQRFAGGCLRGTAGNGGFFSKRITGISNK